MAQLWSKILYLVRQRRKSNEAYFFGNYDEYIIMQLHYSASACIFLFMKKVCNVKALFLKNMFVLLCTYA